MFSKSNDHKTSFFSAIDDFHAHHRDEWRWVPAPYFLKTFPEENVISFFNLCPFDHRDPNFRDRIQIQVDKPLNFHSSLGWNWHKSWILPEVKVKLLPEDLYSSKVFIRIYVVKAGLEFSENFFLVDIGVKGVSKVYLQDGVATFRNLKFSSTSYNNEGLKFHLVVLAVEELAESPQKPGALNYRVLDSKLSPPIYVDSRKSAREINFKENTFLDMFSPELLQRPLIKKRRKNNSEKKEELIGNSLQGFVDYYTAPNIRNKIKHPFFIALKFSACITLFYNRSCFQSDPKDPKFAGWSPKTQESGDLEPLRTAEKLREILAFLHHYNENLGKIVAKKKKTKLFLNKAAENAYLAILIRNTESFSFSKKVSEFLGSFDKRIIKIVLQRDQLSDRYQAIEDLNLLKRVYTEEYAKGNESQSELPPPEYFLKRDGKRKRAVEEEQKEEKPQFIPEITTMIRVNECRPGDRRERERGMRINPEEMFKGGWTGKNREKMSDSGLKIHENSQKIDDSGLKIENIEPEDIGLKVEAQEQEDVPQVKTEESGTGDQVPLLMQNRMFGMFGGGLLNAGMMGDFGLMNGMLGMGLGQEEYMEKMRSFMNNRQKLDYLMFNSMFPERTIKDG